MIGTTHVSRGTRGDYDPSARPGDITGRRLVAQADEKIMRDNALRETRNALTSGEPLELVSIPGGRTMLLPREVCLHLMQVGADVEADSRHQAE
jgi:hypothetical protein